MDALENATTVAPSNARFESLWPARVSVLVIVTLQLLLNERLSLGPNWLAPMLELGFLAVLFTMSHERRIGRHRTSRLAAMVMTLFINSFNLASLVLLVESLLHGSKSSGTTLLIDALNIWLTNMIVFALWYWELDQGGPHERGLANCPLPDFLFPQMTAREFSPPDWSPGFVDYLFVSFTNATAFSPTDTLPLTPAAKALMMVQAATSLLTVALVASRAVNILT